MKKIFLAIAVSMAMVACGQQDKEQGEKTEQRVVIPPGMPTPPVKAPIDEPTRPSNQERDPNTPVLRIEEGKPLDLSQLLGGQRKSFGEQVAEMIDSIQLMAKQGDADYQYLLGGCYDQGWGVDIDYAKAMEWYKKAADQEQKASYNAIGNLYRTGQGVKQDQTEAFKWFEKGAKVKDTQAMLNLGNCYYFGMGTQKNLPEAIQWWSEAAKLGNPYALAQMGDCYFYGIGVEKDLSKAVKNLEQAAERNIAGAQYRLGILYYAGQGVKKDLAYSELLMKKARDGGMKEAQDFLDKQFKK